MGFLTRTWLRADYRRRRFRPAGGQREDIIRRFAPGKTFADIGCMWNVHGAMSFVAVDCGATRVTAMDGMDETPEFLEESRRRPGKVRFVRGDAHRAESMAEVGVHDVVWCSGVIYHSPNPMLLLEQLRAITGDVLILSSEMIPEVPGVPNANVFFPGLDEEDGRAFGALMQGVERPGVNAPMDPSWYGNNFWGFSPSGLRAMIETAGFNVIEVIELRPFHAHFVARVSHQGGPLA